ncbi:MAG: TIGR03936 family radical SAM-associated protein [Clostridia bacterium]|nr:TIGR03936 family radical SAM-associated protein [Clostridia bacterium]
MISFKYTKCDGAEFLSHLDLLRHIYRTLRRAGIGVAMSEGYHAHARIFLNNPLPVGVKSQAEYGTVDTIFTGDFKEVFNRYSPAGIKCLGCKFTDKNPNFADAIERCDYLIKGIDEFDPSEILNEKSIIITDLRGREIDARPRLFDLKISGDGVFISAGN